MKILSYSKKEVTFLQSKVLNAQKIKVQRDTGKKNPEVEEFLTVFGETKEKMDQNEEGCPDFKCRAGCRQVIVFKFAKLENGNIAICPILDDAKYKLEVFYTKKDERLREALRRYKKEFIDKFPIHITDYFVFRGIDGKETIELSA